MLAYFHWYDSWSFFFLSRCIFGVLGLSVMPMKLIWGRYLHIQRKCTGNFNPKSFKLLALGTKISYSLGVVMANIACIIQHYHLDHLVYCAHPMNVDLHVEFYNNCKPVGDVYNNYIIQVTKKNTGFTPSKILWGCHYWQQVHTNILAR